jgi:hypothetical protein
MATSIINDLLRMYIRYMIVKPLFDALFGAPSGPAAPIVQSSPGVPTGRAIGGPVSAGKPFVVGERGAELFVPNSSGSIVPNHKMGGETNNIVVNVNMDNGSVNATDANRLGVLVGNVVKAELVKQSRPGGLLAA